MKKAQFFFICQILSICFAVGQQNLQLNFLQFFGNEKIDTKKYYFSALQDSILIHNIKCYISAIQLEMENGYIYTEANSFHLLDLENPASFQILLSNVPLQKIKFIHFCIGIDSVTSVSGALEGDLDPSNGMYWAWQSGYINFKIEGQSPSCKTRKNKFHFHVGGYIKPFYAIREVKLATTEAPNYQINIKMDWAKLFAHVQLAKFSSIMIPNKDAMQLADWIVEIFSIE